MEINLVEKIKKYYTYRNLVWPDFNDAIKFVITEIGEALELDLIRKNYIRNNPDAKEQYTPERLSEELGDAIFMLIVAGIVEGVDPLKSLVDKMDTKIEKYLKESLGYES